MAQATVQETEPILEADYDDEISFARSPMPIRAPGGAVYRLLFLAGAALAGLGAALPFAPQFSWRLVEADRVLATMGVGHGIILIGGILLIGMGWVARSLHHTACALLSIPARQEDQDADFLLVADQLTTDLSQALSSLLQITEEVATLGEGQRLLLADREAEMNEGEHQNAVFRLASSVDQLGAQVETRLDAFGESVRSLLGSIESGAARASTPVATKSEVSPFDAPFEEPAKASAPGKAPGQSPAAPLNTEQVIGKVEETSMEFFESMERLESAPAAQPEPPLPRGEDPQDSIRIDFDDLD